jgi:hypothetical protein
METIIIQSSDRNTLAKIKAFLKELKVAYEVKTAEEMDLYDPEFVEMILHASKEEGGKEVDPKNIWESLKS